MSDAPIAGWYPDPRDAAQWRWWNGADWTADTAARPAAPTWPAPTLDPSPASVAPAPVVPAPVVPAPDDGAPIVRRRTDWSDADVGSFRTAVPTAINAESANTVWIWLLAFSVYVFGIPAGIANIAALLTLGSDPGALPLVAVITLVAGMIPLLVFAELDGRALRRRGHSAPSALWMLLLPPLVYFLVRRSKLKAEGARSFGPWVAMWIVLAATVIPAILGGVLGVVMGIPYFVGL